MCWYLFPQQHIWRQFTSRGSFAFCDHLLTYLITSDQVITVNSWRAFLTQTWSAWISLISHIKTSVEQQRTPGYCMLMWIVSRLVLDVAISYIHNSGTVVCLLEECWSTNQRQTWKQLESKIYSAWESVWYHMVVLSPLLVSQIKSTIGHMLMILLGFFCVW